MSVPREVSAVVPAVPNLILIIGVATPEAVFTTLNLHRYIVFALSAPEGIMIFDPVR